MITRRMFAAGTAGLLLAKGGAAVAVAEDGPSLALFNFILVDTSLNPDSDAQEARLAMVTDRARAALAAGGYRLVDTSSVPREQQMGLRGCNGCELDLARKLGASEAGMGWVQKVSRLILNINLQIREVDSGRLVKRGSVDIRGDTDESWRHGIDYLMRNRILDS
ncbi:Protein of unknown function [Arboricoccus pini]|uniref:DUF2380 domain-containing protein n=1 Tax=Arboricoccus pini TaxID=1963835 RepID=A0A212RDZ7_9PROT|nr:DUF3280 domain-containing protein [Arboricoccus pini]SNB70520.1 Protein of unknown function [Arboricoccus pini]